MISIHKYIQLHVSFLTDVCSNGARAKRDRPMAVLFRWSRRTGRQTLCPPNRSTLPRTGSGTDCQLTYVRFRTGANKCNLGHTESFPFLNMAFGSWYFNFVFFKELFSNLCDLVVNCVQDGSIVINYIKCLSRFTNGRPDNDLLYGRISKRFK